MEQRETTKSTARDENQNVWDEKLHSMGWINNRQDMAQEKISETEEMVKETTCNKMQGF